jgi:hypothetical protein
MGVGMSEHYDILADRDALVMLQADIHLSQLDLELLSYRGRKFVWYMEWSRQSAVGLGPNLGRARLWSAPIFDTVEDAYRWIEDPKNLQKILRNIRYRGEGSSTPLNDKRKSVGSAIIDRKTFEIKALYQNQRKVGEMVNRPLEGMHER